MLRTDLSHIAEFCHNEINILARMTRKYVNSASGGEVRGDFPARRIEIIMFCVRNITKVVTFGTQNIIDGYSSIHFTVLMLFSKC